jgi:alkylation response protein AidB-like acyl-CoA dehydrogenase
MTAGINRYQADLRDMVFVLFEQFGYSEVAARPPFEAWGNEEAKAVLEETYRFVRDVLGPLNSVGDREGCRLEGGQVYTPRGFREAWTKLYENGFKTVAVEPEHGGQGAPRMLHVLVEELLSGANPAFNTYAGLAFGAAELLAQCGTADQVHRYAEKIFQGQWGGTMCLTEPHAGSDVGAAKSSAKKNPDGTYRIRGTKIFISAGDQDLTENIIHLVLARAENAPPGTKGLSLFIVPKRRIKADGTLGEPNDVHVASLEHKMGINGSATCVLNFGDNDQCVGELVGAVENVGMSQMFKMMNGARIAVGLQGLAVLSTAYLNALEYAKDRKQGANYRFWKDPTQPRVPIIEHPDVRRMLIEMKANVEGIRALVMKLASHLDRARQLSGAEDEQASYHRGQVELLTPLLKAYASESAFRLSAEAIQVYGGAGYLKDHPVEQCCRDAKIFSIYEGTTHIQAMDLVGRKLAQAGGAHFQAFMQDISSFVEQHRKDPRYGAAVEALARAQEAFLNSTLGLVSWSQSDKLHLIPLNANRFLTLMSQLAIGWLLLDAAMIAEQKLAKLPESHRDRPFYEGKRYSALWFARNVLPAVEQGAHLIAAEDGSPMEIPEAAFAAA